MGKVGNSMRNRAFFLGEKKRKSYFEGWYFKCISRDRRNAVALIPGMAISPDGRKHSFVQVINAVTGKTDYYDFPYDCFHAAKDCFEADICGNRFGSGGLLVDISRPGVGEVKGELVFSDIRPYPVSALHPGIMGPLSFVSNMECNHVIIHLSHRISGQLSIDGEILDFNDGVGYIEKDYGRSFPSQYVWIQAGHFDGADASFVFSRARIPFFGGEFPGFFAYLSDFSETVARFASYNGSRLSSWTVDKDAGTCNGVLKGPSGVLEFSAEMSGGGKLRAPVEGLMDREIIESIGACVTVRLTDRKGRLLFEGKSGEAGMEISL